MVVDNFSVIPSQTPTIEHTPTSQPSPAPTLEPTDSLEVASPSPIASPTKEPPALLCSPLAEHSIEQLNEIVSSPYAPPPAGKDDRHHGVDFAYYNHAGRASVAGEGVQSILAGRVAAVIVDRLPYGNMVIVETPTDLLPEIVQAALAIPEGYSLYHLYAHMMETPLVELGQVVACGELLGYAGMTGYNIPVPHLHLETRVGPENTIFEGMVFYDTRATTAEQANYLRWRISGDFQHVDPMKLFSE